MGKIYLLDCTLRDGGYINDWQFGEEAIKGIGRKIAQSGIEMFEVGFIKGNKYSKDRSVFPDLDCIKPFITPKDPSLMYVGMLDMSAPVPIDKLSPYDGEGLDALRVIFKKSKLEEAIEYCKGIQKLGYKLFVQFVGTDNYSDTEFVNAIEKFNTLDPFAVSVVDSFGLIKRKHFLRLVYLADHNLKDSIILGYHAHNNLQQAFGNAEALVEMNLKRDICVDVSVFGMGRGAGNLNAELFAEYLNENYNTCYRIEPILEIMDEYLQEIYNTKFWGYSWPLYLSATLGCHPNYAIYLAEKDSLTVKSFNELLKSISDDKKASFSKENAEQYYYEYQKNFIDDKESLDKLAEELKNSNILILAPGKSIREDEEKIQKYISEKNPIIISVNFISDHYKTDYVFSSNIRRYVKIENQSDIKKIITSNVKEAEVFDYKLNFASYSSEYPDIVDNSGVMLLHVLLALDTKEVTIAGMDGYTDNLRSNYFDSGLDYDFSNEAEKRNYYISKEMEKINKKMKLNFITDSLYKIGQD